MVIAWLPGSKRKCIGPAPDTGLSPGLSPGVGGEEERREDRRVEVLECGTQLPIIPGRASKP